MPAATRSARLGPKRRHAAVAAATVVAGCLFACGGEPPRTQEPSGPLRHDFGPIRHGATVHHRFEIPLSEADRRAGLVPVGFQKSCSCARHAFVLVDRETGAERPLTGRPVSGHAVGAEHRLFMDVTLHTGELEAVDQDQMTVAGHVVLQQDALRGQRHKIPVSFRFAIDAPVSIAPYAHLDMGEMPRSVTYRQTFTVRADRGAFAVSDVRCVEVDPTAPDRLRDVPDGECAVRAEPQDGAVLLHVRFRPAADRYDGPFAFEIVAQTDLEDGYRLRLPVTGQVVGDVQLSPPEQFSFGLIDFAKPSEQSLVITDHDVSRPADFVVASIVDPHGRDLSRHFQLELSEVEGRRRSRHMTLRYEGSIPDARSFRGEILLTKEPGGPPVARVPFVGFQRKR